MKVSDLTLEEKIRLLSGVGAWHTYDCNGKLPAIMMTDGPHGLRKVENEQMGDNNSSNIATCFPTASAVACSWNPELAGKMAKAIAKEAISEKVAIVLGCGINMKRSPLCGRNFEYYSEDPYLAGKMATAYIKAMQEEGIGTSLKHFAGNDQETNRQTSNSEIDERALREIYLKAFEMVVKEAKPTTIMASYNKLQGAYACHNEKLLMKILREEWGFNGAVISDWGAAADIVACIKAGMDLEMPDSVGFHGILLKEAIEDGSLSEQELDRAVQNVIHLVEERSESLQNAVLEPVDYEKQNEIAECIELESAVLLKNDGFLPLVKEKSVLVVGDLADHMRFQGGGSSHINTRPVKNVIQSLREAGYQVKFARGYHSEGDEPDLALEVEAVELAALDLPILFFGGLTDCFEGEGYDRKNLEMPSCQIQLFRKIHKINSNIAFISFGGSPMTIPFLDNCRSVLQMYLGGQAVGEACAKLLSGKANPSGKLAETFPMQLTDVPSYLYFGKKSDDVEYRESLFIGYRYYESYDRPVMFPFGYGLSYTTFKYSDLQVSNHPFMGGKLEVTFKIENTGNVAGNEIAEVYVKNPPCDYLRPVKELRAFQKVYLEPGEKKTIGIELEDDSFSIYDEEQEKFIMPAGNYQILIGASVQDIRLQEEIQVNGVDYTRNDRDRLPDYFKKVTGEFLVERDQFEALYGKPLSRLDQVKKGEYTIYHSLEQLSKKSFLAKIMLAFAIGMARKLAAGKQKDDPEVMMMIQGIKEGMLDAIICQGEGAVPYKMAEAVVLSANGYHLQAIQKLLGRKRRG